MKRKMAAEVPSNKRKATAALDANSRSERKRNREHRRRVELFESLENLTRVLKVIDPAKMGVVRGPDEGPKGNSRSSGISLSRVELLNLAVETMERLHEENQQLKKNANIKGNFFPSTAAQQDAASSAMQHTQSLPVALSSPPTQVQTTTALPAVEGSILGAASRPNSSERKSHTLGDGIIGARPHAINESYSEHMQRTWSANGLASNGGSQQPSQQQPGTNPLLLSMALSQASIVPDYNALSLLSQQSGLESSLGLDNFALANVLRKQRQEAAALDRLALLSNPTNNLLQNQLLGSLASPLGGLAAARSAAQHNQSAMGEEGVFGASGLANAPRGSQSTYDKDPDAMISSGGAAAAQESPVSSQKSD